MTTLFILLNILITLSSPVAQSAVTFTGSSNIRTDGAAAAYNLYAAFAYLGPAATPNPSLYSTADFTCDGVSSTCNTCIGDATDPLLACSPQSSFPTTKISFSFSSSTAVTATSQWMVCAGVSGASAIEIASLEGTSTPSTRLNSTTFSWATTWSTLCNRLLGDASCGTSGTATLTFGLSSGSTQTCASGLTDKVEFKVYIGSAIGTTLTPSTADGTHGEAFEFGLFPGDEKVFIPEDTWKPGTGFPKASTSGLSYTNILFFYSKLANPTDTVNPADIKNNSPSKSLAISEDGSTERDYIEGLENNEKYCFRIASQDNTGIIAYFTPDSGIQCEIPSEVIGLLANKKCFIATAAFGSDLDTHVTAFRQFRNEFLLPSPLGKIFVKTYYHLSPPLAQFISHSDFLRTLTRWILWPLLWFVEMSLAYGLWVSLCGALILFVFAHRILRVVLTRFKGGSQNGSANRVILLIAFISLILLTGVLSQAQTDAPPNEPPYSTSEPGFDGGEITSKVPTSADPVSSPSSASSTSSTTTSETVSTSRPLKNKEATEYIQHPNSKKGLYLIDSSGTYHYKTKQLTAREKSVSLKVSNIPVPKIVNSLDSGEEFNFSDMYGEESLLQVGLDYEWNPFPKTKQIYGLIGLGFSTASGNGFFRSKTLASPPPKESYKLYILPLSFGMSYRFEYRTHQWVVPYLSAGGTYFVLAEVRDDSKKSNFLGTPAAYGAVGAFVNITSWDKDLQFRMDREYGISDMWLDVEFRGIASANKDLDFTAGYLNVGFAVDY